MSDKERQEILEMVAAGKITAAEAAQMLSGIRNAAAAPPTPPAPPAPPKVKWAEAEEEAPVEKNGRKPSWLHIRVSEADGRNKVSVNVPLRFVKFGLKLGRRFAPELEGVSLDELNEMLEDVEIGPLVEVIDEEKGEQVRIYVD
jgi:hypothetical protein